MNSKHLKSDNKGTYYPLFLDINDRNCVVIGGGKVAERKVELLLQSGARVTLISPKASRKLKVLHEQRKIKYIQRACTPDDIKDAALIFTCTDNAVVNKMVKSEAGKRKIPVNVVDNPTLCDFIVPSIIRKGDIIIAISTSGKLPLLSKQLRKKLEELLTDEYIEYARVLAEVRDYFLKKIKDKHQREKIMKYVATLGLHEVIATGSQELIKTAQKYRRKIARESYRNSN